MKTTSFSFHEPSCIDTSGRWGRGGSVISDLKHEYVNQCFMLLWFSVCVKQCCKLSSVMKRADHFKARLLYWPEWDHSSSQALGCTSHPDYMKDFNVPTHKSEQRSSIKQKLIMLITVHQCPDDAVESNCETGIIIIIMMLTYIGVIDF